MLCQIRHTLPLLIDPLASRTQYPCPVEQARVFALMVARRTSSLCSQNGGAPTVGVEPPADDGHVANGIYDTEGPVERPRAEDSGRVDLRCRSVAIVARPTVDQAQQNGWSEALTATR